MDALCEHVFIIFLNDVRGDIRDHAVLDSLIKITCPDVLEQVKRIDLVDDSLRDFQRDLAAVRAVGLVAVVLCGVMARSDHDACGAFERTDCPREHRRRHQLPVDMHTDAVCCENCGSGLCKQVGLVAAVVGDRDARLIKGFLHIIGKTLCCTAHGIDIHSACARAEHTAQAAGAELQITVKPLADRIAVAADLSQLSDEVGILRRVFAPELIERQLLRHIGLHGTSSFPVRHTPAAVHQQFCTHHHYSIFSRFCKGAEYRILIEYNSFFVSNPQTDSEKQTHNGLSDEKSSREHIPTASDA